MSSSRVNPKFVHASLSDFWQLWHKWRQWIKFTLILTCVYQHLVCTDFSRRMSKKQERKRKTIDGCATPHAVFTFLCVFLFCFIHFSRVKFGVRMTESPASAGILVKNKNERRHLLTFCTIFDKNVGKSTKTKMRNRSTFVTYYILTDRNFTVFLSRSTNKLLLFRLA